MSQPLIATYFTTRKRGLDEDSTVTKKKVICLDRNASDYASNSQADETSTKTVFPSSKVHDDVQEQVPKNENEKVPNVPSIRHGVISQRVTRARKKVQVIDGIETPRIVNFFKAGNLSPAKKSKHNPVENNTAEKKTDEIDEEKIQRQHGMVTPTKQQKTSSIITTIDEIKSNKMIPCNSNNLSLNEIKKRLSKSQRLAELKTSMNKLQDGLTKLDNMEKLRNKDQKSLKPFKSIHLEILSPKKVLSSPIKMLNNTKQDPLMDRPKLLTPKKLLSTPEKVSSTSVPAYEKYKHLTDSGKPTLQLPFKYRFLLEVFKAVDTVCAMFFNRKEKITFKKLKPAVQRILRKNFHEKHLAQIHKLYPNAFNYTQEKTRNYGSVSKQDYYQLVMKPITNDLDCLSPQLLIERVKKFTELLTDLVFKEHEIFLNTLEKPMRISRKFLVRWHPEFDLEKCPDVEEGDLPLPPNEVISSSAKDVLSTARNLFSCSTPMERALERLEQKKSEEIEKRNQNKELQQQIVNSVPIGGNEEANIKKLTATNTNSTEDKVLKGVPKSLLEKIRAKQAAKALATMTRRPSQEREAIKYSRLAEIARHARNVYVTEKKSVLPIEIVVKKIENSYKGTMSLKEIEESLQLISQELPNWLSFHIIRNTTFVRLVKDNDLTAMIQKLQDIATSKGN